ncbi:MAG TPA: biliverdin-producing heme oxygenase [Rhabdochlamydiaceae bacterium]|nr:biliverdin-producing heme oxygenase [Rhabdochlamydiaceae bacterium]
MTFFVQDLTTAEIWRKIASFQSESSIKETESPDVEVVDTAQVNHEATKAKFQETEAIREGMEKKPKETLFDKTYAYMEKAHAEAREHPLTRSISTGKFTPDEFKEYLKDLEGIHKSLVEAEQKIQGTKYGHFVLPEIRRFEAIKRDIDAWNASEVKATEEVEKYGNYLVEISKTNPELLIAHMFVNYGGILFGGQKIKYKVQEVYDREIAPLDLFSENDQEAGRGIAYYTFSGSGASTSKRTWIQHFNEMPQKIGISKDDAANFEKKLGDESIVAFQFIIKILDTRKPKDTTI